MKSITIKWEGDRIKSISDLIEQIRTENPTTDLTFIFNTEDK